MNSIKGYFLPKNGDLNLYYKNPEGAPVLFIYSTEEKMRDFMKLLDVTDYEVGNINNPLEFMEFHFKEKNLIGIDPEVKDNYCKYRAAENIQYLWELISEKKAEEGEE